MRPEKIKELREWQRDVLLDVKALIKVALLLEDSDDDEIEQLANNQYCHTIKELDDFVMTLIKSRIAKNEIYELIKLIIAALQEENKWAEHIQEGIELPKTYNYLDLWRLIERTLNKLGNELEKIDVETKRNQNHKPENKKQKEVKNGKGQKVQKNIARPTNSAE